MKNIHYHRLPLKIKLMVQFYSIFFCFYSACSPAEPLRLVIPPIEKSAEPQMQYFHQLLHLVLSKTEATDGPFSIEFYPEKISMERSLATLANGKGIHLVWTTLNPKRERELLPIRISLIGDLNSYRVFLIRKGDQARFDQVKTLADLRKLRVGLGSQWPDADIMRHNHFEVVTTLNYDPLFKMLAANRFDFFPRGLYEVWDEDASHKHLGLTIEKNIMLYYEVPFYFFVNKNNPALAQRLERGLKMALADGSFNQLLTSVPSFRRGLAERSNSKRMLFTLEANYSK
jgi:hypothetical protein